jgi:hypothetical protein
LSILVDCLKHTANRTFVGENYAVDIFNFISVRPRIHLAPLDCNTVTIQGDTFDGTVPINDDVTKKTNSSNPRYKLIVDSAVNFREVSE